MYISSFVFTGLFLGAGVINETCQVSCPGNVDRYLYNVVVVLWMLQ
jgi:hypothetical protein